MWITWGESMWEFKLGKKMGVFFCAACLVAGGFVLEPAEAAVSEGPTAGSPTQGEGQAVDSLYENEIELARKRLKDLLNRVPKDERISYPKGEKELLDFLHQLRKMMEDPNVPMSEKEKYAALFIEALEINNGEIRSEARTLLLMLGGAAVEPLTKALENPKWPGRIAAIGVLGEIGDPRAIGSLMEICQEDGGDERSAEARRAAVIALRKTMLRPGIVDETTRGQVIDLFKEVISNDSEMAVRMTASNALKKLGVDVVELWLPVLNDSSADMRFLAAQILGDLGNELGDERVVEPLLQFLSTETRDLPRRRVVMLLGNLAGSLPEGDRAIIVDTLLSQLQTSDPQLQLEIIYTLGKCNDPRVAEPLKELLENAPPNLELAVATALWQMGDEGSVELLTAALMSAPVRDQFENFKQLGEMAIGREDELVAILDNLAASDDSAIASSAAVMREAVQNDIHWVSRFQSVDVLNEIVNNREENVPDGRPLAVLIYATDDYSRTLTNQGSQANIADLINNGYRVMYYEVSSRDEMYAALNEASQQQKASLVMMAGHGTRDELAFGADDPDYTAGEDERNLLRSSDAGEMIQTGVGNALEDGGQVYMLGCSVGEGRVEAENVVNMLRQVFPQAREGGIRAPVEPIPVHRLTYDENGAVNGLRDPTGVFYMGFMQRFPGLDPGGIEFQNRLEQMVNMGLSPEVAVDVETYFEQIENEINQRRPPGERVT